MQFNELTFNPRQGLAGIHALAFFKNGYGASVVKGLGSYGDEQGLFELAVLKGDADGWSLCYETPITSDVLGRLSPDDITRHLAEIEALAA